VRKLPVSPARFLIALVAFLFLAVYTVSMMTASGEEDVTEEDLTSKSEYGYYIFTEMLDRLDYNIKEWKTPDHFPDTGVLVLLLPSSQYKIRNKSALLDWVAEGNILVQCGVSEQIDVLTGFQRGIRQNTKNWNKWKLQNLESYERIIFTYESVQITRAATGIIPYVYDNEDFLICGKKSGYGEIITIADPGFLTNREMQTRETSVLVSALFSSFYDKPFYYAGIKATSAPKAEGNPILVLFSGRIKFVSIHLLLMLSVYYIAIGIRFGPPELQTVSQQRFLKRHLMGLGAFFQRVNAQSFVRENLQDFYRHRFLKFLSLPRNTENSKFRNQLEKDIPESAAEIIEFITSEEYSVSRLISGKNRMEAILRDMKMNREEK
jgi:hypothetical protein